ncbi:MAG: ATP-binding protein [Myxococcaceae bacterium]|nr:ATP-binding protein [Myxococcaceae bacterium]
MHQFLDFKSFEEASLDLSRPLTVLIGKNGSGKSNAIEGVELLAQIAHGRPLSEITDIGRSASGFQVRGGLAACTRSGKSAFGLGLRGTLTSEGPSKPHSYAYQVHVQPLPEPRIHSEHLELDGRRIYSGQLQGTDLSVRYEDLSQKSNVFTFQLSSATFSLLSAYETLSVAFTRDGLLKISPHMPFTSPDHGIVVAAVARIRRELRAPFVFDPQPRLMRAYERIGNRVLARDGANLSAALYALHKGSEEERAALERILQRIRQLPEEPFEEFDFVVTPLNDVLFGIREVKGGPIVDARLLSDGTLRCLAVLSALETVEKGSRVIIEEFDNGLHPSRVNILTQALSEACERRELKVLVTTHNPATLDGLSREQLEGVVLCVWDRSRKASRLVPLLELPRADVLLERGHLGDLVTRRVLEQHVMPGFEEQQKAKAQEWLDSLS